MKRTWSAQDERADVWSWRVDDPVEPPTFLSRTPCARPSDRAPVGVVARPVLTLAVLAALERRGAIVTDPVPAALARDLAAGSIADVLCDRIGPPGRSIATTAALLTAITGRRPDDAVVELVTGPLGVDAGVVLGGGRSPRANATAIGTVLRAWVRLGDGRPEPALAFPTPGAIRAAWTAASELRAPARPGGLPSWRGPGVVRNVGGLLATGASPMAFGQIDRRAVAVCDPGRLAVAVVILPTAPGDPAALRDRVSAALEAEPTQPALEAEPTKPALEAEPTRPALEAEPTQRALCTAPRTGTPAENARAAAHRRA